MTLISKMAKQKKRIIAILTASAVLFSALGVAFKSADSVTRSYESVDYIEVGPRQIVAATNTHALELLEILEGKKFKKVSELRPGNEIGPKSVFTRKEGTDYFAYTVSGDTLERYNITKVDWPSMVMKKVSSVAPNFDVTGSSAGRNIMVAGKQGIAEVDPESLKTIRDVYTLPAYGVDIAENGEMVAVTDDAVVAFKQGIQSIRYSTSSSILRKRKPFIDNIGNKYAVTDADILKLNTGSRFQIQSGSGYDVDGLIDDQYVYAVQGWGIYKLDKNLNEAGYTTINQTAGWARGVKVARTPHGIRVIVAASDRIYLMDEMLNVLDVYVYTTAPNYRIPVMDTTVSAVTAASAGPSSLAGNGLFVSVDKTSPAANKDLLSIKGGGMWAGEQVYVEVGPYTTGIQIPSIYEGNEDMPTGVIRPDRRNKVLTASADANGNILVTNVLTPEYDIATSISDYPKRMYVRIIGKSSKLNISTTISVQAPDSFKVIVKDIIWDTPVPVEESRVVTTRTIETVVDHGVTKEIITEDVNVLEQKFVVNVSFNNGEFTPTNLSIRRDVTVRFRNVSPFSDLRLKTVVTPPNGNIITSDSMGPGDTTEILFTVPGVYEYSNKNGTVRGKIQVEQESIK